MRQKHYISNWEKEINTSNETKTNRFHIVAKQAGYL